MSTVMDTSVRTGTILALCYSPDLINGVGKVPHNSAHVTKWGIPTDRHFGETRVNSRRQTVPNNRPITVVGVEAVRDTCAKLDIEEIPPGGLGENFLVEGLGDLSDVEPGDRFVVVSPDGEVKVVLDAWKQNDPCANLSFYHKQIVKELYGKRGLLCTVSKEGTVSVGDKIELHHKSS